jgi:hypothetical protein
MIDALVNVAVFWVSALSGSVHGLISELMLSKGARYEIGTRRHKDDLVAGALARCH